MILDTRAKNPFSHARIGAQPHGGRAEVVYATGRDDEHLPIARVARVVHGRVSAKIEVPNPEKD